jgi:hypothetical protein
MKYLPTMLRNPGYQMSDREAPKHDYRRVGHGFIPLEQYIRERPLAAPLLEVATAQVLASKRVTRGMANLVSAYHLCKTQTQHNLQAVA